MLTSHCQRWRDGRSVFVAGDRFEPSEYAVADLAEADARAFVLDHHYSRSYPADRHRVGLWRRGARPQLVGVAVFSVSMNQAVIPRYTGLPAGQGVELGRLVLLDDVAMPGETWFMSRAFRSLRAAKGEVETVVSYADPQPRRNAAGDVVKPGHVGRIYAALSGHHHGKSAPRSGWATGAGAPVSERALSKISGGECGRDYAIAQLVALGAPPPMDGERGAEWVRSLASNGFLVRTRQPGKHVYSWGLTRRARAGLLGRPMQPYPRVLDPQAGDVSDMPLFAILADG